MPGREFLSLPGCGIEGNLKVECGVRKARIKVGYIIGGTRELLIQSRRNGGKIGGGKRDLQAIF